MSKNICEFCNKEFEDKYFDKKQNKCKLHSQKSIVSREITDNFFELLENYIKNNQLVDNRGKLFLKDIIFPNFKPDDIGDYSRLMSKYKKIEFDKCDFYNEFSGFKFIQCHFFLCNFRNKLMIYNIKNLDNTFLFKECKFIKDLSFYGEVIEANIFDNCTFKGSIRANNTVFEKTVFYNIYENEIEELDFSYSIIEKKFILDEKIKIKKLNFNEATFNNKVKIQFCDINYANFYNTKFRDLADFYQTKFKNVNFERTDFEKIVVFSESEFNCNVDFKYTKFFGKSIFRDTVITGTLNLRNSIFDDYANFLDITSKKREKEKKTNDFIGETFDINVKNRETTRIIKNFFDNQNNTIEANKFYALEMKEREKELESDLKNGENILEWLVFKVHGITSNHSQNWTLALFWIFIVGFFSAFVDFIIKNDNSIVDIVKFILMVITVFGIDKICKLTDKLQQYVYYLISIFLIYIFITEDYLLKMFVKTMNVTSFFKTDVDINIFQFGFKIILAYLIYQLIVSIRQNTRRK